MQKTKGMNKHQKAVYRVGERKAGREQIAELLEMARSEDAEERLEAAEFLCPCHVQTRIPTVWETLYKLMEDPDRRVRHQAWHTIEDGGKPGDEASVELLERLCANETDPKVRKFAELTLDKVFGSKNRKGRNTDLLWLAAKPTIKQRGKCDFCGATDVFVTQDLNVMIPNGDLPRASLVCSACAREK